MRRRQLATRAVVVLSAIGGAFAGGHPAGVRVVDVVSSGVLAGVVAAFVSRAARWTWIFAAGVALLASAQHVTLFLAAAVVFAAAVATSALNLRNRVFGAVLGAVTITIVMRLPAWGPFGLPTVLAAVAIALVVVSGFANLTQPARRRVVWASITGARGRVGRDRVVRCRQRCVSGMISTPVSPPRTAVSLPHVGVTRRSRHASSIVPALSSRQHLARARQAVGTGRCASFPSSSQQEEAGLACMAASTGRRLGTSGYAPRGTRSRRRGATHAGMAASISRRSQAMRRATRARGSGVALATTPRPPCGRFPTGCRELSSATHSIELVAKVEQATGSARTASLGDRRRVGAPRGHNGYTLYLLMFTTPSRGTQLAGSWGTGGSSRSTTGKLDLTQFGRTSPELNAAGDPSTRTMSGPADYLAFILTERTGAV